MDLKELGTATPEGHWYYETKFKLVFDKLMLEKDPARIVEIGAGSRFFINKLLTRYPTAKGWAVDPNYPKNDLGVFGRLTSSLNEPQIGADLYLFLDVLEHVENDYALLQNCISKAKPGAKIVISVPAFNHLWSGHDVFLEHHRRYNTTDLKKLVEKSNLEVDNLYYAFSCLYPLAYALRKLKPKKIQSDMRVLNPKINNLLRKLLQILSPLNKNKYFGLSAVVIATKK